VVAQRNHELTMKVGENANSDNAMMKTVAIVSLVYLPGTFVSVRVTLIPSSCKKEAITYDV
jgi:hypothetical protein